MFKQFAYRVRQFLIGPILRQLDRMNRPSSAVDRPDAASQLRLKLAYQEMARSGQPLPGLAEVGFKVFSQTDEDGILLYLFSIIGTTTKKSVEVCAGNGMECNTANLIINHGWTGLLVDGNAEFVEQGKKFYATHRATYVYPPTFVHAWITRETVNDLVSKHGFEGEIDVLSLDIDGVDYWVWEALDVVQPRVVVVEYQDILGPERSWTVPYEEDFQAANHPKSKGMPNFCGASLQAFTSLAEKKGYRLVGCNRYGYNAFFVRKGLAEQQIPTVKVSECFAHPKVIWGMRERFPIVKDYPWQEV